MTNDLLQELRTIRNAIAHGQLRPDAGSLAERLHNIGIAVPPADLQWFVADLLRGFGSFGEYFVPPVVLDVARLIFEGRSVKVACDPCARLGVLAAAIQESLRPQKTIACERIVDCVALGRAIAPQLDWRNEDPFLFLDGLKESLDAIASILPFGARLSRAIDLPSASGELVRYSGDFGHAVLAAASIHLSPNGIGLFVVSPSFFSVRGSTLPELPRLGPGVHAALALPPGSFAPYVNIPTYLVLVQRNPSDRMFVAQLSQDPQSNRQIIANLHDGKVDGPVDHGRFVAPQDFRGIQRLRLAEQLQQAENRFQVPAVKLGKLAKSIQLGRSGVDFAFPNAENAVFVPLIGISDVVDSAEEMRLKPQNYAQVVIDPQQSGARFVACFLNSEMGRSIREANKSGLTISKLNTLDITELTIFVPNLETQGRILETAAKLAAEQNTVLALQNELAALHRDLWVSSQNLQEVDARVREFSARLSIGVKPHAASTFDQWFESLPFPLASILRAWQATDSDDYRAKYEHLLHFFEAAAEFLSLIYLSAFSSQPELFTIHKTKLIGIWRKQNLSLDRATFGTWKVVVEYFSKQTRELMSADREKRALCAELFADPSYVLSEMLGHKELVAVLSAANKMRNDWTGHGGVVNQAEAQLRNERLLSELQRLREVMADSWRQVQLIHCLHCKPRRGAFENEIAVLMGSNSEFLKESRSMSSWLDVDRLYLASRDDGRALLLLPLMQVGPSPKSAKNACYFFNRVERDGIRFVSYHFVDQPEIKDQSDEISAAVRLIAEELS